MVPHSREKIPIKCTKCGRINFARRDYLKRLTHPYWCIHCKPHWKPKTIFLERKKKLFEDILKNYHYAVIKSGKRELRIPKIVTTIK